MSSNSTRKQRSSILSSQRSRNPAVLGSTSRASTRQTKVTIQGFNFGDATKQDEWDVERIEKDLVRERKRKEQRLEELERGHASTSSWNDSSSLNVPAASTSAAAIAGLLAGRQAAEQEESFEDLSAKPLAIGSLTSAGGAKKKQSAELRRLLTQRKSLKLLLEDAVCGIILLLLSSRLPQITLFKLYKYPLNILPIEEAALYAQFVATGVIFDASAAAKGYVVSSVVQLTTRLDVSGHSDQLTTQSSL